MKKRALSGIAVLASLALLAFVTTFTPETPSPAALNWRTDVEKTPPDQIITELQNLARKENRPLLLYFYADWCMNCHELEQLLADEFADTIAADWLPVRIDITDSARWEQPAMDIFGVYGAPALAFTDRQGHVHKGLTLVGAHPPRRTLQAVLEQLKTR